MIDGEEWLKVPEAARILGVGRQAIHDAVREGRLKAEGKGWSRRIHISEVLAYAVKTEKNLQEVVDRLQREREVSAWEIFGWIIQGLNLSWLISGALDRDAGLR
jgi:excisionase family DNA binding protein